MRCCIHEYRVIRGVNGNIFRQEKIPGPPGNFQFKKIITDHPDILNRGNNFFHIFLRSVFGYSLKYQRGKPDADIPECLHIYRKFLRICPTGFVDFGFPGGDC